MKNLEDALTTWNFLKTPHLPEFWSSPVVKCHLLLVSLSQFGHGSMAQKLLNDAK
jgi:hypothetical protein